MFYETSFISNLLKCQHCSQPYNQFCKPRMLSCCGDSICDTCIDLLKYDVINKKYKCVLCSKFVNIPDDGFPINRLALKLVSEQPKEAYRGKEMRDLKLSLSSLEELSKSLLFETKNFNDSNFNKHWDDQKLGIQLTFENLIKELTQQKEMLMKKVEQHRTACKVSFVNTNQLVSSQTKEVISKVNSFIEEQRTFMNQIQIDDDQIAHSNHRITALRKEIERERANLISEKNKVLEKSLAKFKIHETSNIKDLLGYFDSEPLNDTNPLNDPIKTVTKFLLS
jgi:hypothetical protein